jgi:hypothetical protein
MGELVPFAAAFALGAVICRTSRGILRSCLALCAIVVTGLAATVLSGEYHASWWFVLPDVAGSAVAVAAAAAITHYFLTRSSSSSRINPQSLALPWARK